MYARRALAEPPAASERGALLFLLGTAEWRAGQPDAIAHLEQALSAAHDDLGTVIPTCGLLGLAFNVADRAERAVEVFERALAALVDNDAAVEETAQRSAVEPLPPMDATALALVFETGAALVGLMDERTAPAAMRRAEDLRGRLDSLRNPPVYLLVVLAYHAARTNRASEARRLAERALECEPYPPPLDICSTLIIVLTLVERYEALQRLCEDVLPVARQRSAMQSLVAILDFRAAASCDCGALADAEADTRWALEQADGINRIQAVGEVVRVLIERDALEEAESVLEQCDDPLRSRSIRVVRFLIARGRLRAGQGRFQEALEDFLACQQRCEPLGLSNLSALPWRSEAALIQAALGNTHEARRLGDEQLEQARVLGLPRTLGISLRACGLVEGGQSGLQLLREAVQTLERSRSPLELARALSDYGAALRRTGHRVQARAELERALDLAHRCGARRVANQARAEMVAAGARPRRDAITGRDALTAGELRVARLAAQGLSNREIAQALFITTKTAKAHLGRVYRKLEITRRGQLADALTGVVDDGREDSAATATTLS